jgi:hypothetical protein
VIPVEVGVAVGSISSRTGVFHGEQQMRIMKMECGGRDEFE